MSSFDLEILTPQRVFYRGECVSLMIPITDGMLGIMANREPITASITCGEASYTTPDGKRIIFSVSGGMVDAVGKTVKLLCDSAYLPEEIDEEKARRDAETARSELSRAQSKRDYTVSKMVLSNAMNNLRLKHKEPLN